MYLTPFLQLERGSYSSPKPLKKIKMTSPAASYSGSEPDSSDTLSTTQGVDLPKAGISANSVESIERPVLDAPSLVDLRQYDQSKYDRGRPGWFVLLWWLVQAIAFPLSPHTFNAFRRWLLRLFGAKIGKGVIIRPTARFTYPWKVEIGDYSWIGDDVVFYSIDWIRVGCHCSISQKSYLCTASHDIQDQAFGLITSEIAVGNGVWIATDCFIAPGVQIGANAVIGARSSVFRNIPAQQVCWGTPARPHYQRQIYLFRQEDPRYSRKP